ncbi:TIGR03857 family LLM class F420-dependent oxidoreductase [Desertimonas flava]|uniref:TIGR03857 family LLM class F420-dependent oxidoreductase n=1 Tax=Desertimonas flava TaxID=2064846 RepID=UPI000E346808|nr:TIGR03857 family LLM class F420-dependent oxidoreductase [Desertimonas flava]
MEPTAPPSPRLDELAYYLLPGGATTSAVMLDEVRAGERMGFGTAFISERLNVKEAAGLSGAAIAASTGMRIATGVTNINIRHPAVTAAFASTLHDLSGGRFVLGLGRGIPQMQKALGLSAVTTAHLEEFARLMRRLWHGEVIVGYDGVLGSYPVLALDPRFSMDIPLLVTAFGPDTLAMAGRAFDEVMLHTYFTDETTARCVATVRRAAEEAGRDPAAVKVWSCFATLGDHLPHDVLLKKSVGRMATYLQAYGDLLVTTNRWDPAVLERFRADEYVSTVRGAIDQVATTGELEHVATLIPEEWLAPSASGSPRQCAAAVRHQLDLGCDGVILHGASPDQLAPVVEAYRPTN